jgi:hypothetical protein
VSDSPAASAETRTPSSVFAPALAAACAMAAFMAGVHWGTNAVGGSDSHCYVGQARMFVEGHLALPSPLRFPANWPHAAATFVPSGFAAGPVADSAVPLCPAGLSLVMAGFMAAGGTGAWFWVVPVFGAIAVWASYRLGTIVHRWVGVAAAALVLCSPTFLYQLFQPMSDVPATALWAAALAAACRPGLQPGRLSGLQSGRQAAWTGLLTGLAVMMRPNLAPLAAVPAWLVCNIGNADRAWPRRGLAFVMGLLPGVIAVAAMQTAIYGSPVQSGYGPLGQLFRLEYVGTNVRQFAGWLNDTHSPAVLLVLIAPFLVLPRRVSWALLGFVVATCGMYLAYRPFDNWSYTRFLLPALPAVAVLTLAVVWSAAAFIKPRAAALAAFTVAAISLGGLWVHAARTHEVFRVASLERKYVELGHYAATRLPRNAVVLAAQSTGAVRHYASLPTLSWDAIDPAWLERVAGSLRSHGLEPYLAVESFEADAFRSHFRASTSLGELDWPPRASFNRAISLHRLDDRAAYLAGATIPSEQIISRTK